MRGASGWTLEDPFHLCTFDPSVVERILEMLDTEAEDTSGSGR